MIGVVIATHGEFGTVLLSTLRMILGEIEGVRPVALNPEDAPEAFELKMTQALQEVDPEGKGALVAVDMLGGTPFNVAVRMAQQRNLQVVTGVNLPMLILIASHREGRELEGLVQEVQKATRESIVTSLELFKK